MSARVAMKNMPLRRYGKAPKNYQRLSGRVCNEQHVSVLHVPVPHCSHPAICSSDLINQISYPPPPPGFCLRMLSPCDGRFLVCGPKCKATRM